MQNLQQVRNYRPDAFRKTYSSYYHRRDPASFGRLNVHTYYLSSPVSQAAPLINIILCGRCDVFLSCIGVYCFALEFPYPMPRIHMFNCFCRESWPCVCLLPAYAYDPTECDICPTDNNNVHVIRSVPVSVILRNC